MLHTREEVRQDFDLALITNGLDHFEETRLKDNGYDIVKKVIAVALDLNDIRLLNNAINIKIKSHRLSEEILLKNMFDSLRMVVDVDRKVSTCGEVSRFLFKDMVLSSYVQNYILTYPRPCTTNQTENKDLNEAWHEYVTFLMSKYNNLELFLYRCSFAGLDKITPNCFGNLWTQ